MSWAIGYTAMAMLFFMGSLGMKRFYKTRWTVRGWLLVIFGAVVWPVTFLLVAGILILGWRSR